MRGYRGGRIECNQKFQRVIFINFSPRINRYPWAMDHERLPLYLRLTCFHANGNLKGEKVNSDQCSMLHTHRHTEYKKTFTYLAVFRSCASSQDLSITFPLRISLQRCLVLLLFISDLTIIALSHHGCTSHSHVEQPSGTHECT